MTVGVWILFAGAWLTGWTTPQLRNTSLFWLLAILFITTARAARARDRPPECELRAERGDRRRRRGRPADRPEVPPPSGVRHPPARPGRRRPEAAARGALRGARVADVGARARSCATSTSTACSWRSRARRTQRRSVSSTSCASWTCRSTSFPRLFEVMPPNVEVHSVEGIALLGLRPVRLGVAGRAVKRLIDVVGSACLLILTAPLFAVIAWRIRRGSPGPGLLPADPARPGHARVHGAEVQDDDRRASRRRAPRVPGDDHELDRDGRRRTASTSSSGRTSVTEVGRWLRRTSLDELPQLAERAARRHVARRARGRASPTRRRCSRPTTSTASPCRPASPGCGR